MIYHFPLQPVALIVGICLILLGVPGLFLPAKLQNWARQLPRSYPAGVVLLSIDLCWTLWLVATMEMGEFQSFRRPLLIFLPIGFILALRFVDEFLAVRALGILCLLAAEPQLDAAFLRVDAARLAITIFAYVMVVLGILWVTMPYLLRDQINWTTHSQTRWRSVHGLCAAYGLAVLALALTVY
jgi:hypothetical protein